MVDESPNANQQQGNCLPNFSLREKNCFCRTVWIYAGYCISDNFPTHGVTRDRNSFKYIFCCQKFAAICGKMHLPSQSFLTHDIAEKPERERGSTFYYPTDRIPLLSLVVKVTVFCQYSVG